MAAATRARDGIKYARFAARRATDASRGDATTGIRRLTPHHDVARAADVRSPDRGEAHVRRPRVGEDGCDHRRDEDAHGTCGARDRARTRRGRRDDDDATRGRPYAIRVWGNPENGARADAREGAWNAGKMARCDAERRLTIKS